MMLSTGSTTEVAHVAEVRRLFNEYRTELQELAFLVTLDEDMAAACVIEARRRAEIRCGEVHEDCSMKSARFRTISAALEFQQKRIVELACSYHSRVRANTSIESLTPELLEILLLERPIQLLKLDVLCRSVLILCGVENQSFGKAAWLMGITCEAVQSAFDTGIAQLQRIQCALIIENSTGAMQWN